MAGAATDRLVDFDWRAADDRSAPDSVPAAALDRVFVTDNLALSLMATVARWGGPRADRLYRPERFAQWLAMVGLPPTAVPVTRAQLVLLDELRLAVFELVSARLAGEAPPVAAVPVVNGAAQGKGVVRALSPTAFEEDPTLVVTFSEVYASVAQACLDAVVRPASDRLRQCERSPCGHVFIDRTTRGGRRWCTSESCGNLARGQRHRDSQRVAV